MSKRKVIGAIDRIDRRNLVYFSLYNWANLVFNQFYRKVEVHGLENIPKDAPVIFAPNHQNALMDALIVLFSSPGDTVFLARADLFRKKLMAKALNSLKILPVFRIRDGVDELGKNQEIFDITVGVLHRKHQLCIMPEGNHSDRRRLRNLGKGIFRIAFKTQEKMGNKPYVKIVPVGLDFSDFVKQYQNLHVVYGKPIEVSDYWDEYEENGPRGLNLLKQRLADEMKPLMIHIETKEYYDMYLGLRTVFNERMREILGIEGKRLHDKFLADKEMILRLDGVLEEEQQQSSGKVNEQSVADGNQQIDEGQVNTSGYADGGMMKEPSQLDPLREKVERYMRSLEKLNIRDWVVKAEGYSAARSAWRWFTLLLTLPVFLYGFINNALMYFLPVRAVRNIKDIQFHSSVKAGLAMLLVLPLTYLLQTLLVGIFTDGWYIWAGYLVLLYPTGKLALLWYLRLKKTLRGGWFGRQYRKKANTAVDMVELRQQIVQDTEELIADR